MNYEEDGDSNFDGIELSSQLYELIDLKNYANVEYWSIKLRCAGDELFEAVYSVGLMVKDVMGYLDKLGS